MTQTEIVEEGRRLIRADAGDIGDDECDAAMRGQTLKELLRRWEARGAPRRTVFWYYFTVRELNWVF